MLQGFFKTGPGQYAEGDRFLGLTVPQIRSHVREFEALPFAALRTLIASPWHEERLLALLILVRRYARGDERERQRVYDFYMRNIRHVNNWDLVDLSAEHIVGAHLKDSDGSLVLELARSPSLWKRRIAMLATFHYIKKRDFAVALRVAEALVADTHDLIHKAVGWMLREIGQRDRAVEEKFLARHAAHMPRTALRYAIEKFPEPLRRKYMERR